MYPEFEQKKNEPELTDRKKRLRAQEMHAGVVAKVKAGFAGNKVTGDEYQARVKEAWCGVCGVPYVPTVRQPPATIQPTDNPTQVVEAATSRAGVRRAEFSRPAATGDEF